MPWKSTPCPSSQLHCPDLEFRSRHLLTPEHKHKESIEEAPPHPADGCRGAFVFREIVSGIVSENVSENVSGNSVFREFNPPEQEMHRGCCGIG